MTVQPDRTKEIEAMLIPKTNLLLMWSSEHSSKHSNESLSSPHLRPVVPLSLYSLTSTGSKCAASPIQLIERYSVMDHFRILIFRRKILSKGKRLTKSDLTKSGRVCHGGHPTSRTLHSCEGNSLLFWKAHAISVLLQHLKSILKRGFAPTQAARSSGI